MQEIQLQQIIEHKRNQKEGVKEQLAHKASDSSRYELEHLSTPKLKGALHSLDCPGNLMDN